MLLLCIHTGICIFKQSSGIRNLTAVGGATSTTNTDY